MNYKKMNYIIVSPIQYCGGPIVLHYLCKLLNEYGYSAKVFLINTLGEKKAYENTLKYWCSHLIFITKLFIKKVISFLFITEKNYHSRYDGIYYLPVKDVKIKYLPFFNKKKTIVVYPEIVYGNFLKAKYVVRWLLYYNRYVNDPNAFGKNDLVMAYREIFNDTRLNPSNNILTLSYFNMDLYKQTNFEERKGYCYVIRKGKNRTDLPAQFDGPIIDNFSEFEKVKAFNKYKYCILYDMQTAYASIAALCGCIPIQIPEQGKTRKDYCGQGENRYGVAIGQIQEEIDWALNTRPFLLKYYTDMRNNDSNKVNEFIKMCDGHFFHPNC